MYRMNTAADSRGWSILPLSLSPPNQRSYAGPGVIANPSPANTDSNDDLWGVWAFEFVYNGGQVTFSASAATDLQTGNRFGHFIRSGTTNNPIPQTSSLATDGVITFIPTPSACVFALVGIAWTIRRRR